MACTQNITTTSTTNNTMNTICNILKRIEQMQKNAIATNLGANCESCLMGSMYNTKPISINVRGTLFNANIGLTDETTQYFRVEEVRGEVVVLRLLVLEDGVLTCTNNTISVCINCICSVQCFDAINCNFANCSCLVEA